MPSLLEELRARAIGAGLKIDCASDGSSLCEIAIVAEAPGPREVQLGAPLVGGSGRMLWDTLRPLGITRKDCYVTNVSKRQVALGDDRKNPLQKTEKEYWQALLKWELAQLPNLRFVLALGGLALDTLCGIDRITNWRGSVLDAKLDSGRAVQVVAAFNPANVLRDLRQEVAFRLDCAKLRRVIDGKHKPPKIVTRINPTADEAIAWCEKMARERRPVSFDIETIGNETACVGLANSPVEGMCIAFRNRLENAYTLEEEIKIRRALQKLFRDTEVRFIAQNASFDSYWLWYKDRIHVPRVWFDTMLAHHTLYPRLPHNLGFLCTQYTDFAFYKDEGKQWREGGDIDSFWRYNVHDCCITWACHEKLAEELRAQGLDGFFHNHVMRLQPHLVRMTVGGVLIDVDKRQKLNDSLTDEVQEKLQTFHRTAQAATNDPDYLPNPRSPKQLSELMFSRLGLIGRGASTDDENRDNIYNHPRTNEPARAMIRALNAYATEHKFLSTYVETQIDDDDRIRCEWKQSGVQRAPGRLSSAKVLWGAGQNLQNIPQRGREIFIADPGYCFVYFDLSQAEARVVAWLANIPKWKEQFERAREDGKYDCHRALASEMFKTPYDQVPEKDFTADHKPTMRFIAKRCRHGLNYRMGPERLSMTAELPRQEAYTAYSAYHNATPELRRWWDALEQEVRKRKELFNAYGRRFIVLERLSPDALESIVAFKPQSTVGDKVSRVIWQSERDPTWPKRARIALNIHDALIALAPVEEWKQVARIMVRYAEEPILIDGESLVIPAELGVSKPDAGGFHRWATIKKIDKRVIY